MELFTPIWCPEIQTYSADGRRKVLWESKHPINVNYPLEAFLTLVWSLEQRAVYDPNFIWKSVQMGWIPKKCWPLTSSCRPLWPLTSNCGQSSSPVTVNTCVWLNCSHSPTDTNHSQLGTGTEPLPLPQISAFGNPNHPPEQRPLTWSPLTIIWAVKLTPNMEFKPQLPLRTKTPKLYCPLMKILNFLSSLSHITPLCQVERTLTLRSSQQQMKPETSTWTIIW